MLRVKRVLGTTANRRHQVHPSSTCPLALAVSAFSMEADISTANLHVG
jgi:hypothetical protein